MKELSKKWRYALCCGLGSAAVSLVLWLGGLFDSFENVTWDLRVRALGRVSSESSRVKLILLDQDSLDWGSETMGLSWPWPREMYTPLLQFLHRTDVRGVAFDVMYTEPSAYGVEDDRVLGDAMGMTSNMVCALFLGNQTGNHTNWPHGFTDRVWNISGVYPWLKRTGGAGKVLKSRGTFPVLEVAEHVALLGNVHDEPDRGGVFRRMAPFNIFDGRAVPSLGMGLYLLAHTNGFSAQLRGNNLLMNQQTIPLDEQGRMVLNYRGDSLCYDRYKAAAVIQSELRLQSGEQPVIDPEEFRDCYVLFGFSAPALLDLRSTPVNAVAPGVFIHATLLDNLISGDWMRDQPTMHAVVPTVIIFSLLASLVGLLVGKAWRSVLVYAACLGISIGVVVMAYEWGYWFPFVPLMVALMLSVTAAVLVNYATEGRQKLFIKKAFQHYLSHDVIERILNNPDQLQLGGERKELTIFFSDLQGFSTFSERMGPQELTALLNDYLSDMTDIIFDEGGTLDKYEGDAIIAFWNAPLNQEDHALRACRAALRCQERLAQRRSELAEKYGAELHARIGIHTGEVVVGNMGSRERFDYTVLGDAANLASRLEGANKPFGTYLMVSEETWKQTNGVLGGCPIGRIRVVGRKTPVMVYMPMTFAAEPNDSEVDEFKKALDFVFSNDWKNALESFQRLEKASEKVPMIGKMDQKVSNDWKNEPAKFPMIGKYISKCNDLLESGGEWDGVWNLTEK